VANSSHALMPLGEFCVYTATRQQTHFSLSFIWRI